MGTAHCAFSSGTPSSNVPVVRRTLSPEAQGLSERCILVVDDDRLLRWAIAETLGARGFHVSEAGDAESAERAFAAAADSTDLVLLDLYLPDSQDLRVLSFIRRLRPNIPVVVMTAHGTPDVLDQAARSGAVVATKPFDMSALAALVEREVTGSRH